MASYQGTPLNDIIAGSGLSDLILGLAGNDSLSGNGRHDTLDGGAGADTLAGGTGNDSYVIDSAADKVVEAGGDSDDRLLSAISIDLKNYAEVEHATLTGVAALNATGDGANNMLIGNVGANKLDGAFGGDTLIGGGGNDSYIVDSVFDLVIEYAGDGVDQVTSSATQTILEAYIENLVLTNTVGTTQGHGNAAANKITGAAGIDAMAGWEGNDTLIGNAGNDGLDGGTGADSMVGGSGDNFYVVDSLGDKVLEAGPSTDRDWLASTINYTLGANLENLQLQGKDAVEGTGNGLDNYIEGSEANSVLVGMAGKDSLIGFAGNDLLVGGAGNDTVEAWGGKEADTLVGGAGADIFQFNGTFSFSPNHLFADLDILSGDTLDLSNGVLSGFVPGVSDINDYLRVVNFSGLSRLRLTSMAAASPSAFNRAP